MVVGKVIVMAIIVMAMQTVMQTVIQCRLQYLPYNPGIARGTFSLFWGSVGYAKPLHFREIIVK